MKNIGDKINEGLNVSKSFVLNMKELDYDKLIDFIKDMQSKNEDFIELQVDSSRKWIGYSFSKGKTDNIRYNKTELN